MRYLVTILAAIVLFPIHSLAQKDTRNVMLNAESATVPRAINIGLPDSENGAVVFVDGMRHSVGLPRSQYHWAGGNAYEPVGTIDLMEAVVRCGEFGVVVDSRTRFLSDRLSGVFTTASSSNGLIRFDGALQGPLGKNCFFSAGAYLNYDPTSVNAPSRPFVDQKQIYQFGLSRKRNDAVLNILYRFSFCGDRVDGGYSVAPFIYHGDGSIGLLQGFRLGRDCYMSADETVNWMDLATGEWRSGDMSQMDRRFLHDFTMIYKRENVGGWKLGATFHLLGMSPSRMLRVHLAGIDDVSASQGISLSDGTAFSGKVQNRQVLLYDTWTVDPNLLLQAERQFKRHHIKSGLDIVMAWQYEASSSFRFAHTVSSSPVRLYKDGQGSWNFNRNSTYFQAGKFSAAFFFFDDWRPVDRLLVRSGLRLKPLYNNVISAPQLEGELKNARVEGFNLSDPALCELHHFRKAGLDYVWTEHLNWRMSRHFSLMGEGFYSMTNKATTYYRNATLPSLKAIGNALARGGLTFETPYFDCAALVSYITSWNNAAAVSVTKQIGGISETLPWVAQYGIGTLGFTLDGNLHLQHFGMHARATWQNPTYKNYRNEFVFSDGSISIIDYTGKTVTGISRLMLEFDPSYRWDWLRIWGSVRYYSRQYVSRTNLAYFNGHFETFAGADVMIGAHHKISLNLVNLLMQSGAKGSIDIADTIEDASLLENYTMAGSYIRPFTVDLSYTYRF